MSRFSPFSDGHSRRDVLMAYDPGRPIAAFRGAAMKSRIVPVLLLFGCGLAMAQEGIVDLDYGMNDYASAAVNGAEIAYLDIGEGEPVVLIAGALGDFRAWEHQIEELRSSYRVIAVTLRRAFPNPPSREPLTPSESEWSDIDDVSTILDGLDTGPVHLLGHSFGGAVALAIALERPDLVASLVLEEPAAMHYDETIQAIGAAVGRVQSGDIEGGLRDFINTASGPGYFDEAPSSLRESFRQNAATVAFANAPPQVTCEQAGLIEVPVLFLEGEHTPLSTEIKRCFHSIERVVIPNSSHRSHTDNPAAFNRAVVDFLNRVQ